MPLQKAFSLCLLLAALALPATSKPDLAAKCRYSCKQQYELCRKRTVLKGQRSTCAAARKTCKSGCVVQHQAVKK